MHKRGEAKVLALVLLIALVGLAGMFWVGKEPTGQFHGPLPTFGPDNKQSCFIDCFAKYDVCRKAAYVTLVQCRERGRTEGECGKIALAETTNCIKKNRDCRSYCARMAWRPTY